MKTPAPAPAPAPARSAKRTGRVGFDHEKLEVYALALGLVREMDDIAGELPRGRGYIADQLRRASVSIPLNIAEGAGESPPLEKARFYRMARRSGTECAALLDVIHMLTPEKDVDAVRRELLSVTAMLVRLCQGVEKRVGQGQGQGQGQGVEDARL